MISLIKFENFFIKSIFLTIFGTPLAEYYPSLSVDDSTFGQQALTKLLTGVDLQTWCVQELLTCVDSCS